MSGAEEADFSTLTRVISERAGLVLDAYKDKCLKRRIAVRMRACGAHTYADYRRVLDNSPAECERLGDALTINVTRFYRNPETWNRFAAHLLPELLERREGRLRIWSAGCASGEEPYTIAMLVAEACAVRGMPEWIGRARIDATDIDRVSLERAAAARYRAECFADTPAALVDRYTLAIAGGEREVVSSLRDCVHIQRLDFSGGRPPEPEYDLICCRNVVIYFERTMQERLFLTFADLLAPDGILILGKVETLFGPARDRLVLVDARERIYRRPA